MSVPWSWSSRGFVSTAVAAFALAVGAVAACGEEEAKPQAGATVAGGGAAGAGGQAGNGLTTVGAGGDGAQCAACIGSTCPVVAGTCATDPDCLTCASAAPYPAITCFQSDPLNAVLDCLCRDCTAACPQANCEALPCVRCVAKTCSIEYEACSKKPSCSPCTLPNPPDTCPKEPLAVALYLCALETCDGVCDFQAP